MEKHSFQATQHDGSRQRCEVCGTVLQVSKKGEQRIVCDEAQSRVHESSPLVVQIVDRPGYALGSTLFRLIKQPPKDKLCDKPCYQIRLLLTFPMHAEMGDLASTSGWVILGAVPEHPQLMS